RFDLPGELADRVRGCARELGATPYMVYLAAFQVLLARFSGRRDVTVGTAVSRRDRPELSRMAGYAITGLPLRAHWTGAVSFVDFVAGTRRSVLDAFAHREVPVPTLVAELEPERDASRTPLFQVVFDMVADGGGQLDLPGLAASRLRGDSRFARFDLTLQVTERDGRVAGHLEYATALFDVDTARRIARCFVRLLDSATRTPEADVTALDLLPADEREQLLVAWNDTATDVELEPVYRTIERQAARTPGAVALIHGEQRVSYAELDARANRYAHHLRVHGVGPESRVGVLLERGPELVACLLGIWKAGGAYVALDPGYPAARLGLMLAEADAVLAVASPRYAGLLAEVYAGPTRTPDAVDGYPTAPVPPAGDLDNLAYVIYTSGSTGRPKGVLVPHRGLANYLLWTVDTYAAAGTGGAPVLSSVAFDLGIPDLYTPLMVGQPVHLLPQEFDVADLGRLLSAHAPYSFVKVTPAHVDLLSEQLSPAQVRDLAGVIIAAGDSFTCRLANRWRDLAGSAGTRIAAEYGPTEITVGNSYHPVTGPEHAELVSIGRPIPNTTMYALDGHLRPVPVGVVGEVYIGGVGVARGYLNRPELTAQRFVPDPFGGVPGARLYRSGDLARVLPGGDFEFLGRIDHQVKLRGYRIELGEIEAVLCARAGVRDAVAVVREDTLVAYVVPDSTVDVDELAGACRDRLPAYMVPSAFVVIDAVPLTANGKVDRPRLPAPDREALGVSRVVVAPRDGVEQRLAAVWSRVLGVVEVSVVDSFFDLGGDSIRAVALVGALREAGFDVAVRDVFEARSIAGLATLVAGRDRVSGVRGVGVFEQIPDADRALVPEGVVDAYPMSMVQTGMLVEMLADEGTNRYHNVTSFRIRDQRPLAPDALRSAAQILVRRHEVLRTGFDLTTYSVPMQLVHADATMPVEVGDLRGYPEARVQEVLHEVTRRERAQVFDVARPPLLRAIAHHESDKSWWLTVTECHPILEGWSHHSWLMELLDTYRQIRDGIEVVEPEPAQVRYADFIAGERRALSSAADRGYWRDIVTGYAKFELPPGWGDPTAAPEQYLVPVAFHDLEPSLRELGRAVGASMKAVLLAAHLKVLSQLTAEPDFHAGLVCDGRPEAIGAERVYGMYLNTLPFAVDRSARTWRDLVRQVFAREVELWPHRHFPLPEIQREVGGQRLVDVMFNYQDFRQVDHELVDYLASIDDSPTEFPLTVSTRVGYVLLSPNTRHISRANGARLAAMYRAVLEAMAADPDGDARAVRLPDGEREAL
ncbi:MAG TPA: amino acid adenylation domain-containing protein, partial [Rugosimonospora sp.]|nr:amino acid adenylation domain-containing protein [Rugosimonospora sp.]